MDIKLGTTLILGIIGQILGWVNYFEVKKKSTLTGVFFQRPFKVELQNSFYELFHPQIIDFNLTIKNKTIADVRLNFLRDISEMFMDFEVLHDSGDGKYDMVYTNKTIDLCMFLSNRKSNALFDITYRILSDYGDLPKKCPLRMVNRKLFFFKH